MMSPSSVVVVQADEVLQRKKGVVSEEGLERLVKRYSLDAIWDDRAHSKVLIIAGTTFTLEIVMKEHNVQTVELQYAFSGEEVTRHTSKAEAILLENLKLAPGQHPWTKRLDDFANNLEPLAILDKLSVTDDKGSPVLVTYDAIAGLVESLHKIHEWDYNKLREDPNYSQKPEEHIRTIAMCERNGRPLIHSRGVVGMGLEYWRDRRYHVPSPAKAEAWYKTGKSWSILVSCARRDPMVYPAAVRVSSKWIGDDVETATTEGLPAMLNWQEPPAVVLPDKPGEDLLLAGPKYPEVMFTAVFNPPVTLPISEWEQIHHYAGAPVHAGFMHTFDYLIFPAKGDYNPTEPRMVQAKKTVRTKGKDMTTHNVEHENRLFVHKPVYGQTLTELPFSHPSQLVNMLPTLRQYAFLWNLLDKAFGGQAQKSAEPSARPTSAKGDSTKVIARSEDFDAFMRDSQTNAEQSSTTRDDSGPLKVDVTLNAHPQPNPKLQIMFSFRGRPAQIMIDIGRNGVVQIESTNVVDDQGQVLDENGEVLEGSTPNPSLKKERLARLLMLFEDIDEWCEWIRINVGP